MGGCRCFFRDCRVNSYKQTRIHFFHVPLKHVERAKQWIKYGKLEFMLAYPTSKQKNVIVCARHFRDECFMNYKKDRLTPTAIPTISRLSKEKALDYELDLENGTLVTLPETQLLHLILPDGFECTLGLENDENLMEKLREIENPIEQYSDIKVLNGDLFMNEIGDVVVEESNTDATSAAPSRSLIKRPLKPKRKQDDILENSKKIRIDQISLPQGTIIELESPNIINHQIIETENNAWVEQDSYSISNNGGEFELIEVPAIGDEVFKDFDEIENEAINNVGDAPTQASEQSESISSGIEVDNSPLLISQTAEGNTSRDNAVDENNGDLLNNILLELSEIRKENANLKDEIKHAHTFAMENERKLKETHEQQMKAVKTKQAATEEKLLMELSLVKEENVTTKAKLESIQKLSKFSTKNLKEQYEKQMAAEKSTHNSKEEQLLEQIQTLQQGLEHVKQELAEAKRSRDILQRDYENMQTKNTQLLEQELEMDIKLQCVSDKHNDLDVKYKFLLKTHEDLQKSNAKLEEDYKKLETKLENQVATITTTDSSTPPTTIVKQATPISANTLSKAQLFNGIKRYISSSMMALLRMEMFGNSDREWKTDEKQVATDLLRLGENVYKFFTDEWRLRLPGLRDVRNWLSQSVQLDEEEDL
ncbi:uncharacterized protein [Musca autumnalis]|uniref:uncharacterized protein n=1 Tax=Musca autumnalis TaxID=221902 RepID=UPI003CF1FDE8